MNYKTLIIEKKSEHILLVTLNRPERRNAINIEMMQDLLDFWKLMSDKNNPTRCIILTGKDKAFCAGADLKDRSDMALDVWRKQHNVLQQAMRAMVDCPIPVIAAVNGAAFGGGLELTLASDFAYASTDATFAQSEVKVGIMPGAMGTQNLPRACGIRRAKELTFTADTFSAAEAFEWGIINKVFSPEKLITEALTTANKITQNAPLAIKQVKKALNIASHTDIQSGYSFEVDAYNLLLDTQDRIEGIRAFNEKRKAEFSGK
jgi:enoyl-CoA hydratase